MQGKEVSSKVLQIFFKPVVAKGGSLVELVAGTELSVAELKRGARMSWADLCTVHHNTRRWFDDAELEAIGRSVFRHRVLRFAFVIARLLMSPMSLYRWLNTPRDGVGNQMFSCVRPRFVELGPNRCEIELTLPPTHETPWDFFLVTKGNLTEMPTLFGYQPGVVTVEPIPHGARFQIEVPTKRTLRSRAWAALTWPFAARAAARELKAANETLVGQREVLDTAYRIGQRIWGERDPAATAHAIATALVEIGRFAGATVTADDEVARVGEAGGARIAISSRASFSVVGEAPDGLLDLLGPTLALALDNAFASRALDEYRENLEVLVDERTAELREAQGAREKFFSHISHEIRTPLSLVILAAADVEARATLDERGAQSLGAITGAARRLLRLVDELLLLAAGQEDKLVLRQAPWDLATLLGQLHVAWRPAAEHAGLALIVRAPQSLVALVDAVALERVATNLVSNAIKYTPRGGAIELELADEPDGIRLSVRDTGVGIDDELAARLFQRFARAKSTDALGTGIGLSLVKQLVEAHGGTIAALSRDSGGTEMRVVLPAALRTAEAAGAARATERPIDAPAIRSGQVFAPAGISAGTILLAEDDPHLAHHIATLLSGRYTVVVALDGVAALELVATHQPHLLITDVEMPRMTGLELAPKFRAAVGDQLAPIVILSAVTDLATRVAGLQAGAIDYVGKPFDPRELEARVDAQFRMRDLAVRLHRAEQVSTLAMLTSGLAHELRNPANGIVNAIEPIRELLPANTPDGVVALLDVMQDCATQLGVVSSQLLGFRSGNRLELRCATSSELLARAASIAACSLAGVTLVNRSPARDVRGAPQLLIQVLSNLLENGAYAAGKGGWVEVRVEPSAGGGTVFEITDSGPGVPVGLRAKIFEPFFTTKPQGVGTGLGLSVSRAIIQRHAGSLELRDRAFVIELP